MEKKSLWQAIKDTVQKIRQFFENIFQKNPPEEQQEETAVTQKQETPVKSAEKQEPEIIQEAPLKEPVVQETKLHVENNTRSGEDGQPEKQKVFSFKEQFLAACKPEKAEKNWKWCLKYYGSEEQIPHKGNSPDFKEIKIDMQRYLEQRNQQAKPKEQQAVSTPQQSVEQPVERKKEKAEPPIKPEPKKTVSQEEINKTLAELNVSTSSHKEYDGFEY